MKGIEAIEKPISDDVTEAKKLALPLDLYQTLKRQNMLKLALPIEECSCGSLDGVLKSLVAQYDISSLMTIRNPEHKKGKELFLACLFVYSIRETSSSNNRYDICIPFEDNFGIDIYVREIDITKRVIYHRPIQICEMPEKWINNERYSTNLENRIFEFLEKKKLGKYGDTDNLLLVWLELEKEQNLDVERTRDLFNSYQSIGYSQIVVFGFGRSSNISTFTAYSREFSNHFCYRYDCTRIGKD